MAVVFESKEASFANAASPEQDARYRRFGQLLEDDPQGHDGEIVPGTAAVLMGRLAPKLVNR